MQVLDYHILYTDNYCSQCSAGVVLQYLSLHDQIRTQGIVRHSDSGMSMGVDNGGGGGGFCPPPSFSANYIHNKKNPVIKLVTPLMSVTA